MPAGVQRGQTKEQIARERDLLNGQVAKLVAENEALVAQRDSGGQMVPAAKVVEVAREVARRQGWCTDGVNDALSRIGIDPEKHKVCYEVEIKVTVLVDVAHMDLDDTEDAVRDNVTDFDWAYALEEITDDSDAVEFEVVTVNRKAT